jgi:drug/metabolite transporter (DMT)-like permease
VWIFLALTAALGAALRDVASKQAVRRADPVVVAFGVAAMPAVLLGTIVWASGPGAPGEGFWTALVVSGGINAIATPLIVVALKWSDLSLVAPLTGLTPLFMIGTGAVVLGELPGAWGAAGVATIVVGAWLLALPEGATSPFSPLGALLVDPGARAMLVVAALYSVSSTYDKVGTQASSPLFWAAAVNLVVSVVLGAVLLALWRRSGGSRENRPTGRGGVPMILAAGLLAAVMAAAQMTALQLTLAAYVIAVKRISTLLSVVLGHSVFAEGRLAQRLAGAVVMLAGFVALVLRG